MGGFSSWLYIWQKEVNFITKSTCQRWEGLCRCRHDSTNDTLTGHWKSPVMIPVTDKRSPQDCQKTVADTHAAPCTTNTLERSDSSGLTWNCCRDWFTVSEYLSDTLCVCFTHYSLWCRSFSELEINRPDTIVRRRVRRWVQHSSFDAGAKLPFLRGEK